MSSFVIGLCTVAVFRESAGRRSGVRAEACGWIAGSSPAKTEEWGVVPGGPGGAMVSEIPDPIRDP